MLVWVDKTQSGDILSTDDITEAEVCVVRMERIWSHLNALGWTKDRLINQRQEILDNLDDYNDTHVIDGLKFSIPKWLKQYECPINILIERETYRKIADYHKVFEQ